MARARSARVERSSALQPWAAKEPASVPTNHQGQQLVLLLLAVTLAACKPQRHTGCPQPGPREQPGPSEHFRGSLFGTERLYLSSVGSALGAVSRFLPGQLVLAALVQPVQSLQQEEGLPADLSVAISSSSR